MLLARARSSPSSTLKAASTFLLRRLLLRSPVLQDSPHCCDFSSQGAILTSRGPESARWYSGRSRPVMAATEETVGIACFANTLPGFRGILKQRYADFLVNEVDVEGNVVRLSNLELPQKSIAGPLVSPPGAEVEGDQASSLESALEGFRATGGSPEDVPRLREMLEKVERGEGSDLQPLILAIEHDKARRTAIHKFFKASLTQFITDTVDVGGTSKAIRVRYGEGGGGGARGCWRGGSGRGGRGKREREGRWGGGGGGRSWGGRDGKRSRTELTVGGRKEEQPFDNRGTDDGWMEGIGKFLQFHLFKENKDTQDALHVIGRMLGVTPKAFGFAGTKDKRGITVQRVSLFKTRAEKLAALNSRLFGIRVGNFKYVEEGLTLGRLSGNRFVITLRAVSAESEEVIAAAAEGLRTSGFINYFGMQRFGSGLVPTHEVGACLLRGEWKKAINHILDPQKGDYHNSTDARAYYARTGDVEGALKSMPRHLVAERALLLALSQGKDSSQALLSIPRTLRMMYVHSYQSFLFNHAATARIKDFGSDKVVVGDLVLIHDDKSEAPGREMPPPPTVIVTGHESGATLEAMTTTTTTTGEDPQAAEWNAADAIAGFTADDDMVSDVADDRARVRVLTEDDVASGQYSMEDVVLPLVGGKALLPKNAVGQLIQDLCARDKIDLQKPSHQVPQFALQHMPGGYRRLLQKPLYYDWSILSYEDPTLPLSSNDLDALGGYEATGPARGEANMKRPPLEEEEGSGDGPQGALASIPCSISGGDANGGDRADDEVAAPSELSLPPPSLAGSQKAVQLRFTLPPSCYATMAVRELLKASSETAHHKALNNMT